MTLPYSFLAPDLVNHSPVAQETIRNFENHWLSSPSYPSLNHWINSQFI